MSPRLALALWFALAFFAVPAAWSEPADLAAEEEFGPVPPRLAWLDGDVGLERAGTAEAQSAVVNMPLAPGDLLRTGPRSSFELQIGPRAFARGWSNTALALERRDRDGLALDLLEGDLALDIRKKPAEGGFEIRAGGLSATIRQAGYYRITAAPDKIVLQVRRGGEAAVTLPGGESLEVISGRELTLDARAGGAFATAPVPAADAWDEWNIARTDDLVRSESERYVASDLYGTRDLDRYGYWRRVPEYGPVWTPYHVPPGWVPYSTGFWVHDPYYGWTWVDTQPWGWAPFHYGRWVRVHGRWCWAPGPRPVRPVYAPALVVFASSSSGTFLFSLNGPPQAWVALGWGEPCVPWWGRPQFRRPWWGGWGGPRVVNHVVVHHTTVVHVHHLHSFEHARIHHAVVKGREDHFPRGRFDHVRFAGGNDEAGRHPRWGDDRPERSKRVFGDERNRTSTGQELNRPPRAQGEERLPDTVREGRRPQREGERPKEVRTPISEAEGASQVRSRSEPRREPGPAVGPGQTPGRRETHAPSTRTQNESPADPRRSPTVQPQGENREPRRYLQRELRTPISEAERTPRARPAEEPRGDAVPASRLRPMPEFVREPSPAPRIRNERPAGPPQTPLTVPQERNREPLRRLQPDHAPAAPPSAVSTRSGAQPRSGWRSPGPARTSPSGAFSGDAGPESPGRIPLRQKGWD